MIFASEKNHANDKISNKLEDGLRQPSIDVDSFATSTAGCDHDY